MFATTERVDQVNARVDSIKEDLDAIGGTVVELLEGQRRLEAKLLDGQRRLEANVLTIMSHLGVPAVEVSDPEDR